MVIGIPKEIKDQEYRVALLPSAAYLVTCKAVADALGIEYFPFTA
jgi:alanine dehydrogenase